jgi:streptogramin lyase/tRNA A-37 threonylcarbamoyl transferase component Bud32
MAYRPTPTGATKRANVDLRVGTELAGYRIEAILGRGGMGTVYLAEHAKLRRKVALKLLSPELSDDPTFRERFIRESQVAASLDHPNIVPIYEADETDGQLYIAMRHVVGTDLEALISREGALAPEHVISIAHQLAGALDAAHERGLVHRDVKPANVLIAPASGSGPLGHLYLSDFGLTKHQETAAGRLTRSGQFVGTVDYMAPEQIEGRPLDGRADVYSLGCVAFQCLTGQPPFRKDGDVAVMYAHLREPPPKATELRPELPKDVDRVIARAMAKRSDDRYPTAGELAGALQDALPSAPVTVPARPARRGLGRGTLIGIGAGVAAIIAVLIVALVFSGDGDGAGPDPPDRSPASPAAIDNAVARIDAETGQVEVTATGIPNGTDIAFGEGGVWVTTAPEQDLRHFDPVSGALDARIQFECRPGGFSTDLAIGAGAVWVSKGSQCGVVKVNPATDLEVAHVLAAEFNETVVGRIAFGGGRLWFLAQGDLSRVDPFRARVEATAALGGSDDLAVGEGAVWIADGLTDSLLRVSPSTLEVTETLELQTTPDNLVVGGGRIWILNRVAGSVIDVSPETGEVGDAIRVGDEPVDIVAGLDSVWVANHGDGTITRIDSTTRRVTTIDVGGPPTSLAIDEATGTVWVTIATCDAITVPGGVFHCSY